MSGNAEVVPMSLENDHCEEEEVLGEGVSEGEPFDSMTDNEEEVAAVDVPVPRPGITRVALESLDQVDLRSLFTQRTSFMKNVPRCLVGLFRNALRVALAEVSGGAGNPVQLERGWKLFLLLPRMLLHRPPRGGLISKSKMTERFDKFARGEWVQLIHASVQCDEQAAVIRRRKGRRGDDLERRALNFVQVGELSSARQALEGAEVAPGTEDTLKELSDTSKRPDRLLDPIPQEQCHSLWTNTSS